MTIDERIEALRAAIEAQRVNIESLHAGAHQLFEASQRHESAIEKLVANTHALVAASAQDGENIRALARIAEIHERRITTLEGGPK